jgi:hypothetical protein
VPEEVVRYHRQSGAEEVHQPWLAGIFGSRVTPIMGDYVSERR